MKFLIATGLLTCFSGLTACSSVSPALPMDGALASSGAGFEDKGELLTGSRIPQKSTTHVLKRVGSTDFKKYKPDASSETISETPDNWVK